MSFLHTRDAGTLSSRCTLCGHVIRARADRDVYIGQRLHDALTCQQRRTENARPVLVEPERDRKALKRTTWRSCVSRSTSTESDASLGIIGASETAPSATSKPFLAPRYERSTSMQTSATQPVPPLTFRGVA